MPLYDFHCTDCECDYEDFAHWNEDNEYPDVVCPACGSHKKEKLFTGVRAEAVFVNPEGTRKWDSHDYRFKHVQPRVKAEREAAEKLSHMGKDVYIHHDDISSGKNFDPGQW